MNGERRMGERRNIHDECTVHSGIADRVTWNLIANLVACGLLTWLLIVAMDIRSAQATGELRLSMLETTLNEHGRRMTDLERRTIIYHGYDPRGGQ